MRVVTRDEFQSWLVTALRELPTRGRLRPEAAAALMTESPTLARLEISIEAGVDVDTLPCEQEMASEQAAR